MLRDSSPAAAVLLVPAFLGLLAFPLFGADFYVQLFAKIMILAILAMSLNLLVGFAGLVSLGHAAFFGLGAYALVFTSTGAEAANLWTTLPLAVGASAAAALVIGALVLRTSGVYFIMATLAFAQMLYYLFHDGKFAGGSDGVYVYVKPAAELFGVGRIDLESRTAFYYVTLTVLALVYILLRITMQSLFGRVLAGIRVNEHRMRALGYPTFRYKLVAFTASGGLAGLAGYLAGAQFGFVTPEQLGWHLSGEALVMIILGGMGTLFGPVLGAFGFVFLQELTMEITDHWPLLMGGFIILMVLAFPNGLSDALLDLVEHWRMFRRPSPPSQGAQPAPQPAGGAGGGAS